MLLPREKVLTTCLNMLERKNYKDLNPDASRDRAHREAIYLSLDNEPASKIWRRKKGLVEIITVSGDMHTADNAENHLREMIPGSELGYVEIGRGSWTYSNWQRYPDDDEYAYSHSGLFEARLVICQPEWRTPAITDLKSVSTIPVGEQKTAVFTGITPDGNEYHFNPIENCLLFPPDPFALQDTPEWGTFKKKWDAHAKRIHDQEMAKYWERFEQHRRWLNRPPREDPPGLLIRMIRNIANRCPFLWQRIVMPPCSDTEPIMMHNAVNEMDISEEDNMMVEGYACRLYITMEKKD